MIDEANDMTCAEFQDKLPDLIATGESISGHPHLKNCELCRALLADLETIAEAARQLFPLEEEPPDELWEHIQDAIKTDAAKPESDLSAEPA
jgi:predicted anti-sigma-YlaC factor YlaD